MIKKLLLFLLAALVAGFAGYRYFFARTEKDLVSLRTDEPLLAVCNDSALTVTEAAHTRCLTLRWNNSSDTGFLDELRKNTQPAAALLLTLETWPPASGRLFKKNVLAEVAEGTYDAKLKSLALYLNTLSAPVMLRPDPDMEVYVNRYPWQMQGPDTYAAAFRHISEQVKKAAPAVKMVWAPSGYPGTEEYWPGAAWVDMISVTLKGKSESMTDQYPEEKNMEQLIFRKLHRLRFFDKPSLLIGSAKFGAGDFQRADAEAAVGYIHQHKAIEFIDRNAADKETDSSLLRKDGTLELGVFDPFEKLLDSVPVSTEHIFVNLQFLKSGEFKKRFDSAVRRDHHLIVTMEPWKDKGLDKDPQLLDHILAGAYDSVFNQLYAVIGGCRKKIYLRWLHEMEIPIKRYPWQSQDPVKYIEAFRYFVHFIKSKNPVGIYFVWGPAGDRGSMEFWPGTDVVDYCSIAIYGLPDKNITDHNKQESFNTIFKRKYRRTWFAHRPMFITEFGVKGPVSYKAQWLTDAASTIERNKEITGVSYFNDADSPKAWGDIEAPDWGIPPAVFAGFESQLKTSWHRK